MMMNKKFFIDTQSQKVKCIYHYNSEGVDCNPDYPPLDYVNYTECRYRKPLAINSFRSSFRRRYKAVAYIYTCPHRLIIKLNYAILKRYYKAGMGYVLDYIEEGIIKNDEVIAKYLDKYSKCLARVETERDAAINACIRLIQAVKTHLENIYGGVCL